MILPFHVDESQFKVRFEVDNDSCPPAQSAKLFLKVPRSA